MKKQSYILLIILIIVLVFIIGVRYGQNVEKSNKIIDFISSISPTKPPPPSPTQTLLEFKNYEHSDCGVQFTIPSVFNKDKETTTSAKFSQNNLPEIEFACEKDEKIQKILDDKKIASQEFKLNKLNIKAKKVKEDKQTYLYFQLTNYIKNKTIFFKISGLFLPLFQKSFELI